MKGRKHLMAGEYREASDAFLEAVRLDPERQVAHIGQALALQAMKQYDRAVDSATRAMGPPPHDATDVTALVIRGAASHAQQQYNLAQADLEKALELSPNDACAHAELGRVYVALRDDIRADLHFTKALQADPEDHQTYVARGKLYRQRREFARAARDFEKAVSLHEESAAYHFLLGQTRFDNREYKWAIEAAEKAIALSEHFSAAYVLKGASLYHEGKYEEAESCLERAADMARMDSGAWLWLGRTRLELGKVKQAIEDLERIFEFDKKYVAAHRALANAYDMAQKTEEATKLRQQAQELEAEMHEAAAIGGDVRSDAGPSRLGMTDKFDRTTIAAEVLEGRPTPVDVLTQQVRAIAEERLHRLEPWQRDLEVCEAASVVPDAFVKADTNYQKSLELFRAGDFEFAAYGFGQAEELYKAAVEAFEQTVSGDHNLWLNWAMQRIQKTDSGSTGEAIWLILAETKHRLRDREGYHADMRRAISHIQTAYITDPPLGCNVLLDVADVQLRCGDRDGAVSTVLLAADFCEGIQEFGPKSYRLARCAGRLARLGRSDQWTKLMPAALAAAGEFRGTNTGVASSQTGLVQAIAYSEAWSVKRALAEAEQLMPTNQKRVSLNQKWRAPLAFASVAHAATLAGGADASPTKAFDTSYVATCIHLSCLLSVNLYEHEANIARKGLAMADARLGQFDRAWVSAVNVPDPELRGTIMTNILREQIERGEFADALAFAEHLPEEPCVVEACYHLAEARARSGASSMLQLKKWSEEQPGARARAAALAGAAIGVKLAASERTKKPLSNDHVGNSALPEQRDASIERMVDLAERGEHKQTILTFLSLEPSQREEPRAAETFDRSATELPVWWFDHAAAITREIQDPNLRGWTWVQIANAYHEAKDTEGCRVALREAVRSTTAIWNQILVRRSRAQREYDDVYRWRLHHRDTESEKYDVSTIVDILLKVEELQHTIKDTRPACDTLLLALKSLEPMPRETAFISAAAANSQAVWLARVAGRARRRGRMDLADIILAKLPWSTSNFLGQDESFLQGFVEAETGDVRRVEALAEKILASKAANSTNSTYAAILYAHAALLAARQGDESAYRRSAMKVGGLVNASHANASQGVLLQLAEATAMVGQPDAAQRYVDESKVTGFKRDRIVAQIAIALVRDGRVEEASEPLKMLRDDAAKLPARFAIARDEATRAGARPSVIYQGIQSLPTDAERASALAGVGVAMLTR
ncbi:MAG: tetratricopeptide repeat protein [Pirellulaceae bacterium]